MAFWIVIENLWLFAHEFEDEIRYKHLIQGLTTLMMCSYIQCNGGLRTTAAIPVLIQNFIVYCMVVHVLSLSVWTGC